MEICVPLTSFYFCEINHKKSSASGNFFSRDFPMKKLNILLLDLHNMVAAHSHSKKTKLNRSGSHCSQMVKTSDPIFEPVHLLSIVLFFSMFISG